jgi:hypothetical protein
MKRGSRLEVAPYVGFVRPRTCESRLIPQRHKPLGFKPLDSNVIVSKRNKFSGVILLSA